MAHAHVHPYGHARPFGDAHPHGHDHDHAHVAQEDRPAVAPDAVLDAVHAFLRAPSPALEQAMVDLLAHASFLAVVAYDPPLPPGAGSRGSIPAGTTMSFRGRVAPDGGLLLAVYSDLGAVRKDLPGHPVRTTVLDAAQLAHFALSPPHAGAVLNPAGPYLELRRPELARITAA